MTKLGPTDLGPYRVRPDQLKPASPNNPWLAWLLLVCCCVVGVCVGVCVWAVCWCLLVCVCVAVLVCVLLVCVCVFVFVCNEAGQSRYFKTEPKSARA